MPTDWNATRSCKKLKKALQCFRPLVPLNVAIGSLLWDFGTILGGLGSVNKLLYKAQFNYFKCLLVDMASLGYVFCFFGVLNVVNVVNVCECW